jgi:hypothetical protein
MLLDKVVFIFSTAKVSETITAVGIVQISFGTVILSINTRPAGARSHQRGQTAAYYIPADRNFSDVII